MALIYKAPKEEEKNSPVSPTAEKESKSENRRSSRPVHKRRKNRRDLYHNIAHEVRPGAGLQLDPKGVRFANKDKDEEALVVLRRHPATNASWVILTIIMFFALSFNFHFNWLGSLPVSLQLTSNYAWLVLTLLVAWSGFLSWYFNVSVISDKRIVDVDFHDLIYREVSDANLEKIEDVTHNMGGLFGIIFNFGDIYIQTAGAKPQIEFLKVPHPAEVASILRKLREAATD
ncbi:MAG: PH domain-containing protein, partial [Candidatus Shapirobacteria bacterium]|nr:PH domain-containing protein [Candidatus Shapirobacteria bacterium]MDD5074146.1 PH domain-containing protein [Candidatus Shapirobacteria bacterium]MDD5481917.1 PH domain-containing protein [Candidatus Shapirobacteria bacterium]